MVKLYTTTGELKKAIFSPLTTLQAINFNIEEVSIQDEDLLRFDDLLESMKRLTFRLYEQMPERPKEVEKAFEILRKELQLIRSVCIESMRSLKLKDNDNLMHHKYVETCTLLFQDFEDFLILFCDLSGPGNLIPEEVELPTEVPVATEPVQGYYVNEEGEIDVLLYLNEEEKSVLTNPGKFSVPFRVAFFYVYLKNTGRWKEEPNKEQMALVRKVFPKVDKRSVRGLLNVLYKGSRENTIKYTTQTHIAAAEKLYWELKDLGKL